MTSLQRMMAAVHGEPFDMYPFINPYPGWSMMPHWPDMLGLTFLHLSHGTDSERLRCYGAFHDLLGLDWIPIPEGPTGQDKRYRIETEENVPVLVDKIENTRTRYDEFPKDEPVTECKFTSAQQVESLPSPLTAEEMLKGDSFDITGKLIPEYGDTVFLMAAHMAPFATCYYTLGFNKLYEAFASDHKLLYAVLERHTEHLIQRAKALARLGVHGMRINDFFCSAELISEKDYLRFAFPYEQRVIRAMRDEGLVAILEFLGWVEPRLPHIARLDVNCLQTESSLKGYRNDVATYRKVLGEEVCIFGNSLIRQVIEQGSEDVWRKDALEQAKGVGRERRYAICAGSPTTLATTPKRLRRFGEFTRNVLDQAVPPRGFHRKRTKPCFNRRTK
ncbi:hypothetical protein LCGC14_2512770 [marine sediment metagenome]|uniref:Uroporphyrinogen decarboxylase (URO-D) domain-containing protein n=1 Tax=marine sediment metagenome TaxID=412755 RepID=A0A0F9BLL6_9ZZZZ